MVPHQRYPVQAAAQGFNFHCLRLDKDKLPGSGSDANRKMKETQLVKLTQVVVRLFANKKVNASTDARKDLRFFTH